MEKVIIDVPSMYADHHVLVVRELLTGLNGVADVYASSAFKQVMVQYDPAAVQTEAIVGALEKAGYTQDMPVGVQGKLAEDSWKTGSFRRTQTYQADLTMSGEFRKY
jgi:copper chaperone CopZ